MAKGAPYHKFTTVGRPKGSEYRDRVVEGLMSAKISTEGQACKYCGFKAKYKFIRCPECEKENTEVKK